VDLIAEIKARADIVQTVSAHVPLKKAGKDFKARCPFHSEKTPSFTVSADKQLFYCFGCGTGGDVIRFVMLIEKIDTAEAIRRMADRLGIERPKYGTDRGPAEPIRRALDMAARFYEAALTSPVGANARSYLEKRRMPGELAGKFRIGYAPDRPDTLTRRLMGKGVPEQILVDAGLSVSGSEAPKRLRDKFRDRLMFPILDGAGLVVGFGGRVIRNGDRRPKYLNSAETPLFHKGKMLYGYHTAKNAVSADSPPMLVEGYLDVIYAQSAGLPAVAAMGTALTDTQADLLARFRLPVLLAYDGDEAGRKATLRAASLLLARAVEVRIVPLPAGKDPADLVEQGNSEQLVALAAAPRDVFKFLVDTALAMHPETVAGRRQASAFLAETSRQIPDEILRDLLIRAFADGFGLSPSVAARVLKPPPAASQGAAAGGMSRPEENLLGEGQRRLEWTCLGVVMARVDLMALAYGQIDDDLTDPTARIVWDALSAQYERRHELDMDELAEAFADHPAVRDRLTRVRMADFPESNLTAAGFKDLLRRMRRGRLKRKIDELHVRIKSADAGKDKDEIRRLLEEDKALQHILSTL